MLYSKNCLNSYLFYYNPHKNFFSVQNLSKCSNLYFIRKFKSKTQTISSNSLGKNFNYFNSNQNDDLDKRFSFFNFKNKKNDVKEIEKLKSLLNNSNLKEEDKLQIKIAFAEGYLAGGDKNKSKVKTKLYKVIENLFWLAILFCAYIYFFGNGFKIVWLGNKHEISPEDIEITFNDALGIDEAKSELKEVVEFLKDPDKFTRLGGKLPKGVLLVGPPGTGKTLLARAVAGEAGVPFFHAAGSEFDEILVGQGARRIRDLFAAAKTKAPCVIFIDEIDSVGSKRSNSYLHPYANQTINQLLSEMDGFHQNEGVIVLGATNRRNDLDTALLRPGRFDVEVRVGIPDLAGRVEILTYYLNKIKLAEEIDVEVLAKRTLGFSGADIENMCNQAALKAAIEDEPGVLMKHLDNARDKVLMGPEKKKKIPDEEVNRFTAYHEAGHTLVAYFNKNADPVHKVTIIPRGQSLGSTAYIPEKEPYQQSKASMLAKLDVALGGRVAEEMIFGEDKVTSGAYSDLRRATKIAQSMVKNFGMSNKVGLAVHENKNTDISNGTLEEIETEVKRLLQESYERAKKLLKTHNKELHILAQALLKHETLNLSQIKNLLDEKNVNSENNN